MTNASRGSRVVFVGNIPYDKSEEQLIEVFKEVGKVVGFRLVFDRETGKPKGYGFCEFEDPETAASAVRNLNDADVGGRPLRIDFADVDPLLEGRTTSHGQFESDVPPPRDYQRREGGRMRGGRGGRPGFDDGFGRGAGGPASLPPNLPSGVPIAPGIAATDAITQTLATLPPNQLLDIMSQMKSLVTSSPDQARALLGAHPQLAYALFQAMLMMNVVDPAILQRILVASGSMGGGPAAPPAQPQAPHMAAYAEQQQQQAALRMGTPPQGRPGAPPPPPPGVPGGPGYGGMPPQQQAPYQGPPAVMGRGPGNGGPPPQPQMPMGGGGPPAQPGPGANLQEQQRQLLMQVLQLTPDQISALPPDQRAQIMQLKAQLGQ